MKLFGFEFVGTGVATTLAALYDTAKGNPAGTTTYIGFVGEVLADTNNASPVVLNCGQGNVDLEAGYSFTVNGANVASMLLTGNGLKLKLLGTTSQGLGN